MYVCERVGGREEVFDGVTEADTMFGRLVLLLNTQTT